jgi:A/G-specific adenine glycosylase
MIPHQKKIKFQKQILDWYQKNQRDLPWRKTRDPYRIFISEVMSQQTQLSRVIPKYEAWIEKFPTIQSLARAKVSDVLHYWSGLGYNKRALNLKKTAEIITEKYDGGFPQSEKELLSLPGIGQYTARAVLCFAFDQQIAVVDTNVRKVILTQILNSENPKDSKNQDFTLADRNTISEKKVDDKTIQEIATQLLPAGHAYEWNQALMDYAANVLKKEKIPIPKQSKFQGSRRYYRGQILKVLLQKKKVAVTDIGFLIKKDFTENEKEWLQKLLDELVTEGFIIYKNNTILLAV